MPFRISLFNQHTNEKRRVYFAREADAREYFVRLVTNPRIPFAELARVDRRSKVLEVLATFPNAEDCSPEGGAA